MKYHLLYDETAGLTPYLMGGYVYATNLYGMARLPWPHNGPDGPLPVAGLRAIKAKSRVELTADALVVDGVSYPRPREHRFDSPSARECATRTYFPDELPPRTCSLDAKFLSMIASSLGSDRVHLHINAEGTIHVRAIDDPDLRGVLMPVHSK